MTVSPELLAAYRYWLSRRNREYVQIPASPVPFTYWCLLNARRDVASGKRRYPSSGDSGAQNAFFEGYGSKRLRWIERPADIGLRFVGFADDIVKLNHNGWYNDVDGSNGEVVRGVVYQLPGRAKAPRFVAGYNDPNNDGAAAIDFGTIYEGEAPEYIKRHVSKDGYVRGGYWSYHDTATDHDACKVAAGVADQLAERSAEQEREYQAAWQAGSQWHDLGEEIETARKAALALLAERRTVKGQADKPSICAAIRDKVESCLETIREARQTRSKLVDGEFINEWTPGFYRGDKRLREAFNDGAQTAVL